jgi:outer membrane lipoprotein SlyB
MIETAAVGAGIGAIGGAAAGGGKGAGIGAGAGAGLGALAGVLTDRNLRLEKGTTLEVRLDRQLQVPTH